MVPTTTKPERIVGEYPLWFAWKYLPLWYQQQRLLRWYTHWFGCDLLENIYLCGINNNWACSRCNRRSVVICLKISTFVVSTTTTSSRRWCWRVLWFAWKYLPLWYQQQHGIAPYFIMSVVICLKISTFVVSTTTGIPAKRQNTSLWFAWKYLPLWYQQQLILCNLLFIKRI